MIPKFLDKSRLPRGSGVYLFKDGSGHVLYVGKAIDLYHRVASYFTKSKHDLKTNSLVKKIHSVETIIVESELEALILEANLIKKYLPQFNVRLIDDKDYLYIKVTKEDYPRIITARKHELKNSLKYFGPFPSSKTVRETLTSLRKVFPWCSNVHSRRISSKACFYYHLGLCPGSCANKISQANYRKIIRSFIKFLEGKKDQLVKQLTREMLNLSGKQNFEEAGKIKKTLGGIAYLTQTERTSLYLENPNLLEDEKNLGLQELKKVLNLSKIPERIEGYDISNIQGKDASGSMVVLTHGEIDKSQYRKFKIKISGRPNDVAMMKEIISRRLKHPEWPIPELIIVDGGITQVRAASSILHTTDCQLPIFGLAKKMEWLYPPEGAIIKISRKSLALKLLQKLRDEAHRFAVKYHRKLHDRMLLGMKK